MMIKLSYANVQDYQFVQALARLCNHVQYKSTKVAYNIAKIKRKFELEAATSQDLFVKLVKRFCNLDEKGEIASRKDKDGKPISGTYEIKQEHLDSKAWENAKKEFDSTDIDIHCHKVNLSDLDGVEISPSDIDKLMALIEEAPEPTPKLGVIGKPTGLSVSPPAN